MNMRSKRPINYIFAGASLVLGLLLCGLGVIRVWAQDQVTLMLQPAELTVQPGEAFVLDVVISSDIPLRGAQCGIEYDPNLLQVDKVTEGEFFKEWLSQRKTGPEDQTLMFPEPRPDNTIGWVNEVGVTVMGGPRREGVTGSGVFLRYHMRARNKVSGEATVVLSNTLAADLKGSEIMFSQIGNAVVHVSGGFPTPTPQPTPTPTRVAGQSYIKTTDSGKTLVVWATVVPEGTLPARPLYWSVPWTLFLIVGGTLIVIGSLSLALDYLNERPWMMVLPSPRDLVRRTLAAWPRWVSTVLALIPLLALVLIVVTLWENSQHAIYKRGLGELLGSEFQNVAISGGTESYGILPSLWGTVLVSVVALSVAVPASLALAILGTEFSVNPLGEVINTVLGALSGIPPIIYALSSLVLVDVLIRPKFFGALFDELRMERPVPIDSGAQSTLLGGILLGLLVIPFIAPLIMDAIRNVPHDLREASWGLGATRWYTLTRVVLRLASPGIVGALMVGLLKVVGDVVIAAWAIGYLPNVRQDVGAWWDVLQRLSPVTATAAGLIGGLGGGESAARAVSISVSYFFGLVLLLVAFAFLTLTTWLQRRLRKGLGL